MRFYDFLLKFLVKNGTKIIENSTFSAVALRSGSGSWTGFLRLHWSRCVLQSGGCAAELLGQGGF
jgi:hypothetical protein